jgi:hypothetical protein
MLAQGFSPGSWPKIFVRPERAPELGAPRLLASPDRALFQSERISLIDTQG